MKKLLTFFSVLFIATSPLLAQNKNSVQGDFEALQALYNATQGQDLPTLSSVNDLPSNVRDATYPFMYMIDGEIHYLEKARVKVFTDSYPAVWINAGAPWRNSTGWTDMTPETMGDAVGVETDADGRVIAIDMQKIDPVKVGSGYQSIGNNLAGMLPPEINNWHKLQYFNVKNNFFMGAIPSISNWTESIRLSFAGQWWELFLEDRTQWHEPEHKIGVVDPDLPLGTPGNSFGYGKEIVATNRFKTDVPAEIDGFQNLELIEIRHQWLTGNLPAWSDLPSIKGIFLEDSRESGSETIGGPIPDSWGNLTTTKFLRLSNFNTNPRYSGDFPQTVNDNWDSLHNVAINNNSFTGPVPEFKKSRDKIYVTLSSNQFGLDANGDQLSKAEGGGFPSGYFNGDNADMIKWGISDLNLKGDIPEMISDPNDPDYANAPIKAPVYPRDSRSNYITTAVGIGGNSFTGQLPEWIQTLLRMQTFYIVGNSFSGPFPKLAAEQNNLKTFYIQDNLYSGALPDIAWGSRRNNFVLIDGNDFEGEIPDSWISIFAGNDNWEDWVPMSNSRDGVQSSNSFTGTGATLTWDAVSGAVAYEIEITNLEGDILDTNVFSANLVRNIIEFGTSVTISGLPSDTYRWRVRHLNWYTVGITFGAAQNRLSGRLPDWLVDANIRWLNLENNNYTFKDFAHVYDDLKINVGDKFKMGNQKPFSVTPSEYTVSAGATATLDISAEAVAGNEYEWYKEGGLLSDGGDISGATTDKLIIANTDASDSAVYSVIITNNNYPDMGTIESEPITLTIN